MCSNKVRGSPLCYEISNVSISLIINHLERSYYNENTKRNHHESY